MNRASFAILIASLVFASSVGFCAEETDPIRRIERPYTKEQKRFLALDVNGDRKLSLEELQAGGMSQLDLIELDRDGDHFLSMSEFVSRPIPPAK